MITDKKVVSFGRYTLDSVRQNAVCFVDGIEQHSVSVTWKAVSCLPGQTPHTKTESVFEFILGDTLEPNPAYKYFACLMARGLSEAKLVNDQIVARCLITTDEARTVGAGVTHVFTKVAPVAKASKNTTNTSKAEDGKKQPRVIKTTNIYVFVPGDFCTGAPVVAGPYGHNQKVELTGDTSWLMESVLTAAEASFYEQVDGGHIRLQ